MAGAFNQLMVLLIVDPATEMGADTRDCIGLFRLLSGKEEKVVVDVDSAQGERRRHLDQPGFGAGCGGR